MATISTLVQLGELVKIEPSLDPHDQPWRCIYGVPNFIEWLDTILPQIQTTIVGGDTTPLEQVDAIFYDYVSGETLDFNRRFKKLARTPDLFIWEFKTLDIRIFGWIPQKDHFICVLGDTKDDIETYNRYGRHMAQTYATRTQLNLDEPKCLESKEYNDVLSDANK